MQTLVYLAAVTLATLSPAPPEDSDGSAMENPSAEVSLQDALALALEQSPQLRVYGWDIRASEARTIQARLRPNPELSIEIEDIRFGEGPGSSARSRAIVGAPSGDSITIPTANGDISFPLPRRTLTPELEWSEASGSESGLDESQITLSLSQLVELGGKRARRILVAECERDVAAWDYEIARANVLSDTAKAFYEVVAAQEQLRLAEELGRVTRETTETVAARVEAGKVSPIELSTAEAELGSLKMAVEHAREGLETARYALAAHWGATVPQFTRAVGSVPETHNLPAMDDLRASIQASPDLARWTAEMAQREASVALARANGRPDLTVTIGLRRIGLGSQKESGLAISGAGDIGFSRSSISSDESSEHTLIVGASLPLPIFNRNQGGVREAESLAEKAVEERRAAEVQLYSLLGIAHSVASGASRESRLLQQEVLPKAQEAFDATVEGYRQGKFGLLEVLQTERALFDAQIDQLETQTRFMQNIIDIERLTGRAITAEYTNEAQP